MTEKELKARERKQYFHYFRFWFLALGIILAAFLGLLLVKKLGRQYERSNMSAPAERVYDYADVLSAEEEEKLRQLIARTEPRIGCDIVLVTCREPIGEDSYDRQIVLRDMADDFYDQNNYGFDEVHGDGVLLMDNWYEGQMATWLSTCGSVYGEMSTRDIDDVLDAVYRYIETDPYLAYRAYITETEDIMSGSGHFQFPAFLIPVLPGIVLALFIIAHTKAPLGAKTVTADTYVSGGRPVMRAQSDQFIKKFITSRQIPRSDGGGGGSSGGGGGHTSSGGVSHGGGGRSR